MAAGRHRRLAQNGGVMAGLAAVALLVIAVPWVSHMGAEDRPTELYWYYGTWIPDLSVLPHAHDPDGAVAAPKAVTKVVAPATVQKTHVQPAEVHHAPVAEVKTKAKATNEKVKLPTQPVVAKKVIAEPKPEKVGVKKAVAVPKPELKTDTPDGARKLKIDMTLRNLKETARELGINVDSKHKAKSTLDEWGNVDMPVPNLEPGVSTPELPFPVQSAPGADEDRAAHTQSLHLGAQDFAIGKSVVVGPTEARSKASRMAAPAWSPYYLEPSRHPEVDGAAWKWAAQLRQHRLAQREASAKASSSSSSAAAAAAAPDAAKPLATPAAASASASAAAAGSASALDAAEAKLSKMTELSQLNAAAPCPWYGCADGSSAWFSAAPPSATSQLAAAAAATHTHTHTQDEKAPSTQALSVAAQILAHETGEEADAAQIAGAAAFEESGGAGASLHEAHGFGTTNAFTADPISAAKNQYYGGEHRHYGSERPVTSQGRRKVKGSEAFANDMAPAYDIDEPSSFDSIPLASPSAFASRVAAHQPAGDGALADHHMRADVLAAWRDYEHGLSECMQAEATIDPSLKDFECSDVSTGLGFLRDCMQNHKFGLQDMPLTRREKLRAKVFAAWGAEAGPEEKQTRLQNGAWGALPKLVQLSYQLKPKDYKDVYSVLKQSTVFSTLFRLERLHLRCAVTGTSVKPEKSPDEQIRDIDREIHFAHRYMDFYGPSTPEQKRGEAILQGANKGMPWEYAGVRRGAYRNYWPHVRSQYPGDGTKPNLPFGEYYGYENGYFPQPLHPHEPSRMELPRWRAPAADAESKQAAADPLVDQGHPFEHPRPQPRARLNPNTKRPAAFPTQVNGKEVNPHYPRPWQVSSGAPDVWKWAYPPRRADVRPLYSCIDDWHCPQGAVCSTLGVCRVWEDTELFHTPEAVWRTNLTPDWV